jgi:lipoprotein-anchoring transpeptidase ErfK/SrfK
MRNPRIAVVLLTVVIASACAGGAQPAPTEASISTTTTALDPATTTTTLPEVPVYRFDDNRGDQGTLVVITGDEIPIFPAPGADEPHLVMPKTTILGTTTVLATTGPPVDGWVEVMLPIRPNGSTGWVPAEEVHMYLVDGRIIVDLGARELVYYLGDEELLRSPVAVGTPRNPTPTGIYFVTDTVSMARTTGPWGPHALGLSAKSDTITEFNGGDGIIGIHGTNRPGSIGQAASLGCVRLPNDMITLLHSMVPIGTPVEIRA